MPLAIELVGVNKSFGPVHANKDVNLAVEAGSIHGIVGENGAGKSTLMSILYGFYEADSGEIRVKEKPLRIRSSADAIAAGIHDIGLSGFQFSGQRFDCGSKQGMLAAVLHLAQADPEFNDVLGAFFTKFDAPDAA